MKFVLSCYGTRGDIEPSVAVGRELLRRGHDVRIGVPPDLVGFAEAAGLRRSRTDWIRRCGWTCTATSGRLPSASSGGSRI
jgi:Glycosyltransferase family 28 N-terminal domain